MHVVRAVETPRVCESHNWTGLVSLPPRFPLRPAVLNTTQREAAGEPGADPETPPQLCPAQEAR